MVRRDQNRGRNRTKKPAATLDLKAEKVSSEAIEDSSTEEEAKMDTEAVNKEATKKDSSKAEKEKSAKESTSTSDGNNAEDGPELTAEQITELVLSQQKKSSGSFFKTFSAAIIGAVLALVGQQFMPQLVTSGEIQNSSTLASRIDGFEKQLQNFSENNQAEGLKQQISSLSSKIEAVSSDEALSGRVQQLEKTLADLSILGNSDDGQKNQLAQVTAIATKLNKIEERVNADLKSIKTEFKQSLRREVEQVSKAIAEQETLSQLEGVKLKTDTLGKKVATLDAQSSKLVTDLDQLKSTLTSVEGASISSTKLGTELAPLRSALTEIDEKIALFSKREAEALASARRSALAIAFANLKRGMDRGEGFSAELQTVKQLAGADVNLSSFEGLSETGVPNEQTLLDTFPELAIKALAKSDAKKIDGLSWDQLVNKARTAFKYRRTGDVKGETAEAVLARVEHKFKEGHVEDALKEAQALDGQAKQVMTPWLKQVEARLFVETEMRKLEDQLLNSLSPKS
ncbi:MAG: COG4223 family protein [Rhodomicrobiaceae bacterium]